ncbi:hypothetical protein PFICI_06282 [Pestalotiopsis fici W106-1]|uniref:Phage tail collar domain-containing protein n=1 Tax=Pestalotiopsis fici (strain W106-1 / CGMCC3.15140) TaxID=1229662 RepID=W3X5F6_PESFW|nr:uncharacterized protein PFICI_06282 [Pestalotiopsis fici W106-1]ETS81280.1 hypothetical protein PFICI_06282 [Pestalotiopsis fici W106-1]
MTNLVEVPVGTIAAYAADPSNLPSNWVVCDGASFSTATYPDLYKAIGFVSNPDANNSAGSGSDVMNIPDLRGRFIRGDDKKDSTLTAGNTHDWRTGQPNTDIRVTLDCITTEIHYTLKILGNRYISWNDGATSFEANGGDQESRPVNTYLFYIIKIAKPSIDKAPTTPYSDLPLASVIPFGGGDHGYPPNFPSYIRCDGSSASITSLPDLYKVLGTKWSSDPAPNPSNLVSPDLSGKFIRGVDPIGKYDIDNGTRNPAPDGSGQGLGTWQGYSTAIHKPYVRIEHFSDLSEQSIHVVGDDVIHDANSSSNQSWSGGDSETRPKNAAVHFYLSSVPPATFRQDFPVGGIIAIPGNPGNNLDQATWAPCDGSKYNRRVYSALFAAIGTTWGSPGDGDQWFNVPDLNGQYLRGADLHGNPGGDPDRGSRFASLPGGSSSGAGSYQNYATGMPRKPLNIGISYPNDVEMTSKATSKGTNLTAGEPRKQSLPLTNWGDNESAPRSVVVKYFIRAL